MKKFISFLLAMYIVTVVSAQTPTGPSAGKQIPLAVGRIFGKLVDSSGKGIRDASIVVLQSKMDTVSKKIKEVFLKGTSTHANGDFNVEDLPVVGTLKVKASGVGYAPYEETISFQPKTPAASSGTATGQLPVTNSMPAFEKDLGKISLNQDAQQLADVVVTGSSNRLKMDIDKKVFNVDKNIVSAGGTAVDVMKNVPSLNVDINGNVLLRNATPQIYVDGRPTTLSLDQIPADAIESVEVITNPSAKFDASGGNAGILNIILKKNKKSGYNGNVNAGVDKRGGINGGGSFSIRQDKFNLSLSAFGNQMKNQKTSSTSIRNLLTTPNLLVNQQNQDAMNGGFLFGKANLDYFATNRTTLSLGIIRVHGEFNPKNFLTTDSLFEGSNYISYSERNAMNNRTFNATGFTAGVKYLFPKAGEEFTADINVFSGKNSNEALYNTTIYSVKGGAQVGNIRQQILGEGTNKFTTIQGDYVKPFAGKAKLETGVRAQLRTLTNGQGNYMYDDATGSFLTVPSASSNYKNNDNVYAAYASISNSIKDFGYKIGLRAERSDYVGELTDSKETFSNKYPISLFPSLFLSQKLKGSQEVQLSYTRRVNRPFFMQLIPFIDSTDQLTWSMGNAGLKPEFTNSLEASYSKTLKGNNTILASVYYKYTTDLITRYLDTISMGSSLAHPVNTYINANSSRSLGAEITSQNTVTKWWDMNTNLNLYNSRINTDNITGTSQDAMWSYFAKMNNSFKLPRNFKFQLSATYQSKTNLPVNQNTGGPGGPPMGGTQSAAQGYIKSNYGVDLAVQKSFLKNNAASVTLSASDIFRTRRYDQYSESEIYIQTSQSIGDVPMFRLNFAFRFGEMDMSIFKRKNMKAESEGAQGAMQGM